MWTPPHGRGRSREKVLPPPAPLGFEWRVWGSRVTWRRAIGPGGAMTSCSAAAVVEWGGDTHTHTVLLWLGSAMDRRRVPGVQVRVGGGCQGYRGCSVQAGTARLGRGGGGAGRQPGPSSAIVRWRAGSPGAAPNPAPVAGREGR